MKYDEDYILENICKHLKPPEGDRYWWACTGPGPVKARCINSNDLLEFKCPHRNVVKKPNCKCKWLQYIAGGWHCMSPHMGTTAYCLDLPDDLAKQHFQVCYNKD